MSHKSNKERVKLLSLGKMVGVYERDIVVILRSLSSRNEQISLSLGPPIYPGGGYYGTVSIKDFVN